MNEFLFKYRYLVGGILVFVILSGISVIVYEKYYLKKKNVENQEIAALKEQNDLLRQQLSTGSQTNIAGVSTEQNNSDKININTADATELDKLPGIGPAKAADIIAYRDQKGSFQTIEELKDVKGIGDKTFENLKDLVTVGDVTETTEEIITEGT